jgi:hypothetical protein
MMMKTRNSLIAAALAAAGSLGAAQAAEITLYQHPGFGGQQVTVRGPVANVTSAGFNDQTSSIVVSSGRWEVCTAADFQGQCAVLTPGEYPRLDPQFHKSISSMREVAGRGDRVGGWRDGERDHGRRDGERVGGRHDDGGALELYDDRGLRGQRLALDRNVRNLTRFDFNDRAASVRVNEGTWLVCAAANFGGPCLTLGPGAYGTLGNRLSDRISSVRRIDGDRRGGEQAGVELFLQPGFNGASFAARRDIDSLENTAFNDRVASMLVHHGQWEMCSAAGYRGQCVVVGPGRYEHLGDMGRQLSSIRRVG